MRKITMICDRCNKEFKPDKTTIPFHAISEYTYDFDNDIPCPDEPLDLCQSCYKEFEKWWIKPQVEEE